MEIIDGRGKMITVGSVVRYSGTGTTGEVSGLKVEDGQGWARLADSDLWYNTEYLEVVDKSLLERKKAEEVVERAQPKRKERKEKIDKSLEKLKKMREELEEADMGSELCDGGG